jgi:hypothetical protein
MTTLSQGSQTDRILLEIDAHASATSLHLDDYLASASRELNSMTERVNRGETMDHDSREWLITQVDFIVEIIANETLDLGDEMRSNLLQLLLSVANLNEQIRQKASLAL